MPHIHEQAIVAVNLRRAQRFAIDWNQALSLLSRGFSKQLFKPRAEIGNSRRSDERHFVAAVFAPAFQAQLRAARPDLHPPEPEHRTLSPFPARASRKCFTFTPCTVAGSIPKFESAEYRPPMLGTPAAIARNFFVCRQLFQLRARIGNRR